jgi:hypothetical protein
MADPSSDFELTKPVDVPKSAEEYPLAKADYPSPEAKLPSAVKKAMKRAEADVRKPPPLPSFQFTIRDMLVATTVFAFLLGLVVSISRGMPVFWIYALVFFVMIVAWFALGLWKAGYWEETLDEEEPLSDTLELMPEIDQPRQPLKYSIVPLFLLVSAFAFLMSLCTLLPGQNKLIYAAGISGLCTLLGLLGFAMNENRHPLFVLLWWVMFVTYLLTSFGAVVFG